MSDYLSVGLDNLIEGRRPKNITVSCMEMKENLRLKDGAYDVEFIPPSKDCPMGAIVGRSVHHKGGGDKGYSEKIVVSFPIHIKWIAQLSLKVSKNEDRITFHPLIVDTDEEGSEIAGIIVHKSSKRQSLLFYLSRALYKNSGRFSYNETLILENISPVMFKEANGTHRLLMLESEYKNALLSYPQKEVKEDDNIW